MNERFTARSRLLQGYAAAVFALGVVAILAVVVRTFTTGVGVTAASGLLAGLTLLGSLWTAQLQHARRHISVATMFAFALVLVGPVALALIAVPLGTAVDRIRRHTRGTVARFAVGQQALCVLATRAVFAGLAGVPLLGTARLRGGDLPAAAFAAIVDILLTEVAVGIAENLDDRRSALRDLRWRLMDSAKTTGLLLPVAPALVAAAQVSDWLLLPPLFPALAVWSTLRRDDERSAEAMRDSLTELPNRLLLHDRLSQLLAEAGRDRRSFAMLLLDLDHFKDINDTLGHDVGDGVLREVARRLAGAVRDADTVARLGGDEFAVLTSAMTAPDDAVVVAERLMSALRSSIDIDGVKLEVTASIGIVICPEHGTDAGTLLRRADVALYAAKADRGRWAVYAPEADPHTVERLGLLGELRAGIETGQLTVHYQPKAEALTGRVVGFEALVRWLHPTRGMVPPDEFVPLAETTGLIGELTVVVLRQALAQVRAWASRGLDWGVAVNLSARQLTDLSLPQDVDALLRDFGVPAERLTLEVTETTIMAEPTRTLTVLRMLAEIGVRLSIDDFGTGYSSLSYLRRLQAHELKIDRTFVSSMAASSNDAMIVRSTIDLGHNLGLLLVAEGVEDATTWCLLRDLGCDVIQGYHLSRPLPGEALVRWYDDYRATPALSGPAEMAH